MNAADFLSRHGLTLTVKLAKVQKCPKWCDNRIRADDPNAHDHGPRYRVAIRRFMEVMMSGRLRYASISFDYWSQPTVLRRAPDAAEVLAWLATKVAHTCKLAAHERSHRKYGNRARRFFTVAELEELK